MTNEFPKNTDKIEDYYREELESQEVTPSENLYSVISEQMTPLNQMAIKKRRNQRVLYFSLAANVIFIISLCYYSLIEPTKPKPGITTGQNGIDSTNVERKLEVPQLQPE